MSGGCGFPHPTSTTAAIVVISKCFIFKRNLSTNTTTLHRQIYSQENRAYCPNPSFQGVLTVAAEQQPCCVQVVEWVGLVGSGF